jgi:DNA-binding transcriptional LysR family regulator
MLVSAGAGVAVVDAFSATTHARQHDIVDIAFRPAIGVDAWAIYSKERPLSRLASALLDEAEKAAQAFLQKPFGSRRGQTGHTGTARRRTKARAAN